MNSILAQAANVHATTGAPRKPSSFAQQWLQPRYMIVALITLILVVGQWKYSILASYWMLALALGTAVVTELVLSRLLRGRFANAQSAYVSGISTTLLTKPAAALAWPFAAVAFLAIASKYVLTYRGRHLWNPTNFAVCAMLVIAPHSMTILSHEFGNDLRTNLVIWSVGILICWRARILHITATFVLAYLALAPLRAAMLGTSVWTEIAPITGPMYQLFIFFMITDPRTVVSSRKWQVIVAVIVAVVEMLLRLACDYELPYSQLVAPAPAMFALTIVGPIAMWIDLSRTPQPAPKLAPAAV